MNSTKTRSKKRAAVKGQRKRKNKIERKKAQRKRAEKRKRDLFAQKKGILLQKMRDKTLKYGVFV